MPKTCWSKWKKKNVDCDAQRAGRKAWRNRKRKTGRHKRRAACQLYAEYRTPTGTRFLCAARSAKALAKKLIKNKWPASFTGRKMLPAEYRAHRAQLIAALKSGYIVPTRPVYATGPVAAGRRVSIGAPPPARVPSFIGPVQMRRATP